MKFSLPPLFEALGKGKKYTPLDPEIFRMMMKAGIGVDPKNLRGTAPLPVGGLRGGPLEFGGVRPTPPRNPKLTQALAGNKSRVQREGIPTGLTAQRKAKQAQEKSRHRS
jgi:hypothetical protein